jgi:hypothetical protein
MRSPSASRKWRNGAVVILTTREWPPHQNTPRLRYEVRTWELYALGLVLGRHFPEATSYEDISATIHHVARTEALPWEFAPGEFERMYGHADDD